MFLDKCPIYAAFDNIGLLFVGSKSIFPTIPVREAQSIVTSGSVAYSSITATPHELFDQTPLRETLAKYESS
jgi:hypothetical protein